MKLCRLFLTRLESMPVEILQPKILPHREIWPLKNAEKSVFLPEKDSEASLQSYFAETKPLSHSPRSRIAAISCRAISWART